MLIALLVLLAANPSDPIACDSCEEWNAPVKPFRIWGNTSYVGVGGLSVIAVDTGDGLVLLDGALPQSVPLVVKNLKVLHLDVAKVKAILNSHAHFDHAGGIARLEELTHARVIASAGGAKGLSAGVAPSDDPQSAYAERFPAIDEVEIVADGETVQIGKVVFTAHLTPGHAPGSTAWSWQSCEAKRCVEIVYADSMTAVSAPRFRFSDDPERVQEFRASIDVVRKLKCDLLLTPHPGASALFDRADAAKKTGRTAFVDSGACRAYADRAEKGLDARLEQERKPDGGN